MVPVTTNQVTNELLSFQAPISLDLRDISASCSLEKVTRERPNCDGGAIENGPVEIVDLAIKKGDFP